VSLEVHTAHRQARPQEPAFSVVQQPAAQLAIDAGTAPLRGWRGILQEYAVTWLSGGAFALRTYHDRIPLQLNNDTESGRQRCTVMSSDIAARTT